MKILAMTTVAVCAIILGGCAAQVQDRRVQDPFVELGAHIPNSNPDFALGNADVLNFFYDLDCRSVSAFKLIPMLEGKYNRAIICNNNNVAYLIGSDDVREITVQQFFQVGLVR